MSDLSPAEVRALVDAVPHWHHIMHLSHGVVSPGVYDPRELFSFLELPDLRGKRVLDVGARDGFFAFECERLGVYDLSPDQLGTFDVVLFLGVLYHLRPPLLALDRLRLLCRSLLIIESLVCDARFFTAFEVANRWSSWRRRQSWVELDRGLQKR